MGFKGKSISVANYDAGSIITDWNRAGSDEKYSQTWNCDDAGNWNSKTKDGDTKSRDHSVSDQITQLDGNPVSHDLKGNLTKYKYGRKNYKVKYDLDNRIFSVKSNRRKVTYRYDAFGRRIISKKNGNRTALIWWGDSECAEYKHKNRQRVVQHDIMGHPTRLNSVIARDTARGKRKVKLQWCHKNYLDHVYAVSDDNGNLIEHYRYTAFGEPEIYSATGARRNTSAIGNTVMWNTRRYDANNGLYYYKYCHYAANIGRWLGGDPIEESGGVNLYTFVGNEPIGRWDELGFSASFAMGQAGNTYCPPTQRPGHPEFYFHWLNGDGASKWVDFSDYDPGSGSEKWPDYVTLINNKCKEGGNLNQFQTYGTNKGPGQRDGQDSWFYLKENITRLGGIFGGDNYWIGFRGNRSVESEGCCE